MAHTSEKRPQSVDVAQDAQCAGLRGTQKPLVAPAPVASQKNAPPVPQSAAAVHAFTHTFPAEPANTSRHRLDAHSPSPEQASPSPAPDAPEELPAAEDDATIPDDDTPAEDPPAEDAGAALLDGTLEEDGAAEELEDAAASGTEASTGTDASGGVPHVKDTHRYGEAHWASRAQVSPYASVPSPPSRKAFSAGRLVHAAADRAARTRSRCGVMPVEYHRAPSGDHAPPGHALAPHAGCD